MPRDGNYKFLLRLGENCYHVDEKWREGALEAKSLQVNVYEDRVSVRIMEIGRTEGSETPKINSSGLLMPRYVFDALVAHHSERPTWEVENV